MFYLACLLLLLLLTYQLVVQAADAPSISPHEEAPANFMDGHSRRTFFNIIWGCVSTTIICTWTAVHPNIPPRESYLKGTLRRVELMFWTIVAPEILPAWALNQLLAAMTVRDVYNEAKGYKEESHGFVKRWFSWHELPDESRAWTRKHGHFVIMGGIHLVEPVEAKQEAVAGTADANPDAEKGPAPSGNKPELEEGRVTILTLEMLRLLLANDPEIKIRITEDRITDRSKGDALSKIIFILQTSWFVVQCIVRRVEGLHLTQLELTTLALGSLSAVTFILWWDKPLGVGTPVRVYLERRLTAAERDVESRGQSASARSKFQKAIEYSVAFIRYSSFWVWLVLLPLVVVALLLFPIVAFTAAFICTIFDLLGSSDSFPADATHVPTFYVPHHQYPNLKYLHVVLLMALGSLFGGVHCVGWDFPFLTPAEQKLWRIASVAVTIFPIALIPIAILGAIAIYLAVIIITIVLPLVPIIVPTWDYFIGFVTSIILALSMLAYPAARLGLVGLALALLRHLPQSAYVAVNWTKFYPHFF